ncbi:MAG: zinc-binding alcohol dehydrogenase [Hyphomicrobiales bacterium]|nr:zinc-binding alcohol dehydrogenase [Hyphomicrobiales bacterium]
MTSQNRATGVSATALWYDGPGSAVLREDTLAPPESDDGSPIVAVRTRWSAISRGTERLVISGKVPPEEYGRMRCPFQSGNFPFPVKYGYCAAGTVEEGPDDLLGASVFALHPHQDRFWIPASRLACVPGELPLRRATLAANMETALNAVWDSGAGPGDTIVVIGAGIVGLLICYLCARLPGAEVMAVDPRPGRSLLAHAFGAQFLTPDELLARGSLAADVVLHTSATQQGLASALAVAGMEARIVEVSWYGDSAIKVPFGGAFHSQRLQIVSSQVGQVSPSRSPRWSHNRRIAKALELLCDDTLDALITDEFAFEDLPETLPAYLGGESPGLAAVVRY